MENQYIGKWLDNRYEILEQVGVGGMAVVYKAKCHRLKRLVAIKILKSDLAQDAEFRRRFHDESQAVAMLSHPNIMAVYDVSQSGDLDYIVMELLDGITLKQYMQRKGDPLDWREALHFTTQIVKGLGHAHSRGIIHRDIKPQNIMVLRDGSVRVTDFGIARLVSEQQATLTQEALGSVHYISPEQARGSYIDGRSDLYSVGVVLYEMLTGRLPFEGDSPVAVAIQHINSVPLSPRDLNPDIPEALEAITMKAMASNRNQRYSDAEEMLKDLEEFRKNPNIQYDYTPAGQEAGSAEDEPTQVIPVASVKKRQGSSGGRTGVRPKKVGREEWREEEEEFEEERSHAPILMGLAALLVFFIGIGSFLWVTFFSGLLEPTEQYTVPKLEGKSLAEVQMDTAITEIFQIQLQREVYSEKPAGEIIGQDPKPGEKRGPDDLVILVEISAGQEQHKMVDLKGMEYREAYLEVEKLGLVLDTPEYVPSEEIQKGCVISFTPVVNSDVLAGETVHLVISTGPEMKLVPMIDFCGSDIEQVKVQIEQMGLEIGNVEYVPDMTMPGIVLFQSEPASTEVPKGTVIHFTVSMGPDEGGENDQPPVVSPSVSPEPSDLPAVNPSVSPEPTPSYKTVSVDLGGGEGTAHILILVGGSTAYDNMVGRNLGVVDLTILGSGVQTVEIFLDGIVYQTITIDFSAG